MKRIFNHHFLHKLAIVKIFVWCDPIYGALFLFQFDDFSLAAFSMSTAYDSAHQ